MADWQTELRRTVIDVSASRDYMASRHFVVLGDGGSPSYFVKYGVDYLLEECRTLQYLYNLAQSDPRAPRVPKVFDYFTNFDESVRTEYLVMEYISPPVVTIGKWVHSGQSDEECQRRANLSASKIADVISWLHACPLPPNASIGPVGGGVIRHRFFREKEAPMQFANVAALEIYINRALSRGPKRPGQSPLTITLSNLPLQFSHSDITYENFLIHPDTLDIWLVDAQHIGILPAPFSTIALTGSRDPILRAISFKVDTFTWAQMDILFQACYFVQMFDSTLGLDSYGREAQMSLNNNASPQRWKLTGVPPHRPLHPKYSNLRIVEVPVSIHQWGTWKFYPTVDASVSG